MPRIPDDDTSDSADAADAVCNNPSNALCVAVNEYDEGIWPTTGSCEQSDSVSRCVVSGNCASFECLPINSQDVALRIHLKAMRAHVLTRQGTSENSGTNLLNSLYSLEQLHRSGANHWSGAVESG